MRTPAYEACKDILVNKWDATCPSQEQTRLDMITAIDQSTTTDTDKSLLLDWYTIWRETSLSLFPEQPWVFIGPKRESEKESKAFP